MGRVSSSPQGECVLAKGFTIREKLYAQISFFAMGIIGIFGIVREDWRWSIPYIVIFGYGVPGILMRHVVCPRCPHLYAYGDCLQFPPKWTLLLVKSRKTTPLSIREKAAFYLIFLLLPVYPLYWLRSSPVLPIAFSLAAVAWYLGQWFYFCKRCRNRTCPFNRVPVSSISDAA